MRGAGRVLLSAGVAVALASVLLLPAWAVVQLVPARVTLQTSLDARKAAPGEPIQAKLETDVVMAGGDVLPRNTILEGRIDAVQASMHRSDSSLVVTFDQARLRNGEVLRVKVTIVAFVAFVARSVSAPSDAAPAEMPGGATGSGYSQVPMPQGAAVPEAERANLTPPPQGQTQTLGQPQTQASQWQPRGIPGVALTSDIHQPASATFLSKRRNVRVPAGTQMEVAIAVVPHDVRLR